VSVVNGPWLFSKPVDPDEVVADRGEGGFRAAAGGEVGG